MALKLEFKSGEKMIVNGAVLENIGPVARLLVHNRANIMRGREILTAEDSNTPAARTYFSLQCAYLFPEKRDAYLQQFVHLLEAYTKASPSANAIAARVMEAVDKGNLYKALRELHDLVKHELQLMGAFYERLEHQAADDDAGAPDDQQAALASDDRDGDDGQAGSSGNSANRA